MRGGRLQFRVGSAGDDPATAEYEHDVRVGEGRHRGLKCPLCGRIHRGSGLAKQEQRRFLEDGPGVSDSLSLPAR